MAGKDGINYGWYTWIIEFKTVVKKFDDEDISPDIIPKLSLREFQELGITDRGVIMKLRTKCVVFGSFSPATTRTCGAPKFIIPKGVLETFLEDGFH